MKLRAIPDFEKRRSMFLPESGYSVIEYSQMPDVLNWGERSNDDGPFRAVYSPHLFYPPGGSEIGGVELQEYTREALIEQTGAAWLREEPAKSALVCVDHPMSPKDRLLDTITYRVRFDDYDAPFFYAAVLAGSWLIEMTGRLGEWFSVSMSTPLSLPYQEPDFRRGPPSWFDEHSESFSRHDEDSPLALHIFKQKTLKKMIDHSWTSDDYWEMGQKEHHWIALHFSTSSLPDILAPLFPSLALFPWKEAKHDLRHSSGTQKIFEAPNANVMMGVFVPTRSKDPWLSLRCNIGRKRSPFSQKSRLRLNAILEAQKPPKKETLCTKISTPDVLTDILETPQFKEHQRLLQSVENSNQAPTPEVCVGDRRGERRVPLRHIFFEDMLSENNKHFISIQQSTAEGKKDISLRWNEQRARYFANDCVEMLIANINPETADRMRVNEALTFSRGQTAGDVYNEEVVAEIRASIKALKLFDNIHWRGPFLCRRGQTSKPQIPELTKRVLDIALGTVSDHLLYPLLDLYPSLFSSNDIDYHTKIIADACADALGWQACIDAGEMTWAIEEGTRQLVLKWQRQRLLLWSFVDLPGEEVEDYLQNKKSTWPLYLPSRFYE